MHPITALCLGLIAGAAICFAVLMIIDSDTRR